MLEETERSVTLNRRKKLKGIPWKHFVVLFLSGILKDEKVKPGIENEKIFGKPV